MTNESNNLVHGYLDGQLSDEQIRQLNDWIKQDPRNAQSSPHTRYYTIGCTTSISRGPSSSTTGLTS